MVDRPRTLGNAVRAMRPDTLTNEEVPCRSGPEILAGGPGLATKGFKRALRPEEVTKRVRAARWAESNEGPGVNRLPAAAVPAGPSSSVSRLNITRPLSTAGVAAIS